MCFPSRVDWGQFSSLPRLKSFAVEEGKSGVSGFDEGVVFVPSHSDRDVVVGKLADRLEIQRGSGRIERGHPASVGRDVRIVAHEKDVLNERGLEIGLRTRIEIELHDPFIAGEKDRVVIRDDAVELVVGDPRGRFRRSQGKRASAALGTGARQRRLQEGQHSPSSVGGFVG